MARVTGRRVILGFVGALGSVMVLTFVAAYIYATFGNQDAWEFVAATLSGNKESWQIVLAVWAVAAVIAMPITLLTITFLAAPLVYLSIKFRRTSILDYAGAGIAIALLDIALFALQQSLSSTGLLEADFHFAAGAIAIAGPVAMLTLWKVVRPDRL